jgi:hypothetical protein
MAYETTAVPVAKTQEEIRKLCLKHGMAGVQFTEEFSPPRLIVRFAKMVAGTPRTIQIAVPLNEEKAKKKPRRRYGYGYRSTPVVDPAEKVRKQTWRAVFYNLKAMFEAVEFGIQSFEQAFLSHFEWMLPSGEVTTIGKLVIPELEGKAASHLLPAPKKARKMDEVVEGKFREQ